MPKSFHLLTGTPAALLALLCSFSFHADSLPVQPSSMSALPRVTLWAWERREDLRNLDTRHFAVAYLDQTISVGLIAKAQPRRNPLVLPPLIARIPVVRIEAPRTAILNDETRSEVLQSILGSARQPGIAALQIDFDATRSQREFYRQLLVDLRRQIRANLPLSITALASWCSSDDWIGSLPVDEAVPMMFRMEPDRRRMPPNVDEFRIREPLCRTSMGVSTTEPWPSDVAGKRVYVFADHGWQNDSAMDVERRLQ